MTVLLSDEIKSRMHVAYARRRGMHASRLTRHERPLVARAGSTLADGS